MRAVSIENVEPGTALAKTIWANDGRPLLKRGPSCREGDRHPGPPGLPVHLHRGRADRRHRAPDLLTGRSPQHRHHTVREAFTAVANLNDPKFSRTGINFDAISDVAGNLVDQILANPDLSIQIVDLKSYDQYTFQHCVNVAVLGVVLGKSAKLNFSELKDLAIGLSAARPRQRDHPRSILKKPTKLTDEEFKYVYEHPRSGFELLRQAERISAPAKIVALQHHERITARATPRA